MARYVYSECTGYVGRQTTAVDALKSILDAYELITFSNAVKKDELDVHVGEIESKMTGYRNSLSNATFQATNF